MPNFSNGFKEASKDPKQIRRNLFPNNPQPAQKAAPLFGGGRVEAARQAPALLIVPLDGGMPIGADAGAPVQSSEPEEQMSGEGWSQIRGALQPKTEKADDGRPDIVIRPRKKITYTAAELAELGLDSN
jgi:hypothetical protein